MSLRALALCGAACLAAPTARAHGLFVDRFVDEGSPLAGANANDGPAGPSVWRVVHLAASALPRETFPAPFEKPSRPDKVPRGTASPELRIVEETPKRFPSFGPGVTANVRIETVASRGGAYFVGSGPTAGQLNNWHPSLSVTCSPGGPLLGLRLETFRIAEDGRAELEIQDGLFDRDTCAASIQRKAALHPTLLLSEGKVPLVFGLHTDEGILLVFPPGMTLDADALGQPLPVMTRMGSNERGPFRAVHLPVAKGSASTAFATMAPQVVEKWYAAQTGRTADASPPTNQVITVAVDVVQTTSDESPTIVLRTTKDTPESRRPPRHVETPQIKHVRPRL